MSKSSELAKEIRFRKLRQEVVSITSLLDQRNTFTLSPIRSRKGDLSKTRHSSINGSQMMVIDPKEPKEWTEEQAKEIAYQQARHILKLNGDRRVHLPNRLAQFYDSMPPWQIHEYKKQMKAKIIEITDNVIQQAHLKKAKLDGNNVFHPMANESRMECYVRVTLQKLLRMDSIKLQVLDQMHKASLKTELRTDRYRLEQLLEEADTQAPSSDKSSNNTLNSGIGDGDASLTASVTNSEGIKPSPSAENTLLSNTFRPMTREQFSRPMTSVSSHMQVRALGRSWKAVDFREAKQRDLIGTPTKLKNKNRARVPILPPMIRAVSPAGKSGFSASDSSRKANSNSGDTISPPPLINPTVANESSTASTATGRESVSSNSSILSTTREEMNSSRREGQPKTRGSRRASSFTRLSRDDGYSCQRRLETVWAKLEVPITLRLEFVDKFSTLEYATRLSDATKLWETSADLVVAREDLLQSIRRQQPGQDMPTFDSSGEPITNGLTNTQRNALRKCGAYIEYDDESFGDSMIWLESLLNKLTGLLDHLLSELRDEFGDELTFRGNPYQASMMRAVEERLSYVHNSCMKRYEYLFSQ
eukprot:TRINITY_DN90544_c0_g1_i1.p1 TRINITY_DN90544_c0_g1~~TRINITY_DN90544_c0_g1_i1.p1  ORF type:complete len:590 (-),score=128.98 TRINITY_DN90544_c0_g1_i1:79-1848(-)